MTAELPPQIAVVEDDDRIVSRKELSAFLDLTPMRLYQLQEEGRIPPKVARGQYLLRASVRAYVKYLRDDAFKRTRGSENEEHRRAMQALKLRRETVDTEKREIEHLQRKRELVVQRETVEELMSEAGRRVHDALLSLPTREAPAYASMTDERAIRTRMTEAIRERLLRLVGEGGNSAPPTRSE